MIKQIQLRGISRAPSDRMSEDGGLSESLNMYMDSAENAPAFVPEDKTAELGLPEDLYAKRIFIHKTANYENFIVVQEDRVVAYTPGIEDEEPLLVMKLADGEDVSDITSVGNTLFISSSLGPHYFLFRQKAYSYLGDKIYFPQISFSQVTDHSQKVYVEHKGDMSSGNAFIDSLWFADTNKMGIPKEEDWNSYVGNENTLLSVQKCMSDFWSKYKEVEKQSREEGWFTGNVYVRYAIETVNGIFSSMPILVKNPYTDVIQFSLNATRRTIFGSGGAFTTWYEESITSVIPRYLISMKLLEPIPEEWREYILNIQIYISVPLPLNVNDQKSTLSERTVEENTSTNDADWTAQGSFSANPDYKNVLLDGYQTFLIKKINILNDEKISLSDDIEELLAGKIMLSEYISNLDGLIEQDRLYKDDMQHYVITSEVTETYNNRLMLLHPTQQIIYDYEWLNTYVRTQETIEQPSIESYQVDVTYLLRGFVDDKVIKKQFSYHIKKESQERIYAFQIFPDVRAYKMIVKVTRNGTVRYGEFNMYQHPYLNCAYYYGGIENELIDLCLMDEYEELQERNIDDIENKLFVSNVDDPTVFSLEGRYTFQSKIIGVAVATTALSQGQFGQFPLYVFTEDGIWAMETAADGSFVSQKPLSREVCINPDSITSIDNAVVFVTAKAVMMIQGSEVMNISPYMNGRHYTPNESAKSIIRKQEGFDTFIDAISDEDAFMTFMKDAKIAYDYTGQRLVFISPANKGFQYVYKIDTQTWHKVAFDGFDLFEPINSFPECLVMSEPKLIQEGKTYLYFSSSDMSQKLSVIQALNERLGDLVGLKEVKAFIEGTAPLDKDVVGDITPILDELSQEYSFTYTLTEREPIETTGNTKIISLSTVLDNSAVQDTAKGILITRPFDLGMPDVYKSITDIKIRGYYAEGAVKFILQGSDNGRDFYTLNSFRGKSWKLFRIFILADLDPTERISWIDVNFEPRYNTKLR